MFKRQIVLDTETTGMPARDGHRIIEIGAVEIINRRLSGNTYHQYINPEREIDEGAFKVHGLSNDFLNDKPVFFQIADEFYEFIKESELIIHNAAFDVSFMDQEFSLLKDFNLKTKDFCQITDSLEIAKRKHPGQRNNLDALCRRYYIDNTKRELHGALLDAELLANVYLAMTGGQVSMSFNHADDLQGGDAETIRRVNPELLKHHVIQASASELKAHEAMLELINKKAGKCLWQ